MTEVLTTRLLGTLATAALQNASGLLGDSRVLRDAGRFPRALALATLAAEELGKHFLCMTVAGSDLEDPGVNKEFWKRFRDHDGKFKNWDILFIDYVAMPRPADASEGDLWSEMWEEMPEVVKQAMDAKMAALYVDVREEGISVPEEIVSEELASNAIDSVALVVERVVHQWGDADLGDVLAKSAPKLARLMSAMEKAREKGNSKEAIAAFEAFFPGVDLAELREESDDRE